MDCLNQYLYTGRRKHVKIIVKSFLTKVFHNSDDIMIPNLDQIFILQKVIYWNQETDIDKVTWNFLFLHKLCFTRNYFSWQFWESGKPKFKTYKFQVYYLRIFLLKTGKNSTYQLLRKSFMAPKRGRHVLTYIYQNCIPLVQSVD